MQKQRRVKKLVNVMLVLILILLTGTTQADLPERPPIDGFSFKSDSLNPIDKPLGILGLNSGQVKIGDLGAGAVYRAGFGVPVDAEKVINTGSDGRFRLVLGSGDHIIGGPDTLVGLDRDAKDWIINLWTGDLVVYAIPRIQKRLNNLKIQTARGHVHLTAGKIHIFSDETNTEVAVFNNVAYWSGNSEQNRKIIVGQLLKVNAKAESLEAVPGDGEAGVRQRLSPEQPALDQALQAFRGNDLATAESRFREILSDFPYNAAAAYHLGLLQIKKNDLSSAIRNWRRYVEVDPNGAEAKEVPRHLTRLVAEQLKVETRRAIDNESRIGTAQAVPRSIAVYPFNNKGDAMERAIGKALTALIISDFAKVPGLRVLEREKVQILLDELKLSESGLVGKDATVRAGRLLQAEKLITGNYSSESQEVSP